ncbi:MAG: Hsp20/alpha crystallin family protein [Planctomycetes bacterium]|nr:Hsp20/alpha crystallin family protein [Planctomycetota bacterium]
MFGNLSELTNRLDWLRDEMEPTFVPPLNVWEEGDVLKVEAEVPGLKLEDVEVAFDKGELTIKGEKKYAGQESASLHRRERLYGAFARTITVPWEILADQVSAELKDGVLTVSLPKAEEAKPRKVAVKYFEKK